jgi:two-component system OmpR family response regulator
MTNQEQRRDQESQDCAPTPCRILLLDDEADIRRLLELFLKLQGFTIWAASSGREAVELYRQHHASIDLVLLDVQMPGMDGVQTLRALQRINTEVLAIFMSGHTGCHDQAELISAGAIEVHAKPFRSIEELARHLREIIVLGPHLVGATS